MPFLLTNLRIDEVSSVTRGAAKGARVVLMKRDTSTCAVCGGMNGKHKEDCPMAKAAVCKECGGAGTHLEKCSMFAKAWGPDFLTAHWDDITPQDLAAWGIVDKVADEQAAWEKREFTTAQREHAAESGAAMPGGGFPIQNGSDLSNAIRAIGRAKNPGAAKAHIKERARALGMTDKLPDTWKAVKSIEAFAEPLTLALAHGAGKPAVQKALDAARKAALQIDAIDEQLRPDLTARYVQECVDYLATIVPAGSAEAFKAAVAAIPAEKGGPDMDPKELEKLQKRAAFLELLAKATDETKAFMLAEKMDDAAQAAFLAKTADEQTAAIKAKKPFPPKDDDKDEDDMKKRLAKSEASAAELAKTVEDLRKKDEIAICKQLCRDNGIPEAKFDLLMKLRKADPAAAEETLRELSALAKQANPKLFEELGKSGGAAGSAADELTAKAQELLKELKKADPKANISIHKARASIYTDPAFADLAKRVKAEEDARRRIAN